MSKATPNGPFSKLSQSVLLLQDKSIPDRYDRSPIQRILDVSIGRFWWLSGQEEDVDICFFLLEILRRVFEESVFKDLKHIPNKNLVLQTVFLQSLVTWTLLLTHIYRRLSEPWCQLSVHTIWRPKFKRLALTVYQTEKGGFSVW